MAKLVSKITLGVDVAKDQLAIYHWNNQEFIEISNESHAIKAWLKSLVGPVRLAIEPTSHYHLAVVEAAVAQGCEVYPVNPRQLVHYRQAVNVRNKTDPSDAWLLARYLEHEAAQLRRFQPQDRQAQRLWALLNRRATVVSSRQQLQQSFANLSISIKALITQLNQLLQRLDLQIKALIRELGWWRDYEFCCSIPGIGACNAAALVATYHRGAFASSDAFVAYMGLDIRVRESGQFKGKSKLSKSGNSELRRLLYCASNAARNHQRFAEYHQKQLDKGRSKIAARVALARKLARIAFSLMAKQEPFSR